MWNLNNCTFLEVENRTWLSEAGEGLGVGERLLSEYKDTIRKEK
jgi:hypothetical protein